MCPTDYTPNHAQDLDQDLDQEYYAAPLTADASLESHPYIQDDIAASQTERQILAMLSAEPRLYEWHNADPFGCDDDPFLDFDSDDPLMALFDDEDLSAEELEDMLEREFAAAHVGKCEGMLDWLPI